MKHLNKNRGVLFIPLCFISLIMISLFQGISQQILLVHRQVQYRFNLAKVTLTAKSCLSLAAPYLNDIPNLPFRPSSEWFYTNKIEGYHFSYSDTHCYLFRDDEMIYSVVINNPYRKILIKKINTY